MFTGFFLRAEQKTGDHLLAQQDDGVWIGDFNLIPDPLHALIGILHVFRLHLLDLLAQAVELFHGIIIEEVNLYQAGKPAFFSFNLQRFKDYLGELLSCERAPYPRTIKIGFNGKRCQAVTEGYIGNSILEIDPRGRLGPDDHDFSNGCFDGNNRANRVSMQIAGFLGEFNAFGVLVEAFFLILMNCQWSHFDELS